MSFVYRVTITNGLNKLELYFDRWPTAQEVRMSVYQTMEGFEQFGVPQQPDELVNLVQDAQGNPQGVQNIQNPNFHTLEHHVSRTADGVRLGSIRCERIPVLAR